ncbi:MAG: hypothetical protein AAF191_08965 [Verrucomicrobiota bacterium]
MQKYIVQDHADGAQLCRNNGTPIANFLAGVEYTEMLAIADLSVKAEELEKDRDRLTRLADDLKTEADLASEEAVTAKAQLKSLRLENESLAQELEAARRASNARLPHDRGGTSF